MPAKNAGIRSFRDFREKTILRLFCKEKGGERKMRKLISMVVISAFILAGLSTPVWSVDQTIQVKVDGMNCDMCPPAVSKALKGVEGVKSAEVSLKDGKAVVVAGEGVKTEDLIKAVEASGHFKAQIIE